MSTALKSQPRDTQKKFSKTLIYVGFICAALFFLLSGYYTYRNTATLLHGMREVEKTHTIIVTLESLMTQMVNAETGQRGFIITGDENFLAPYDSAKLGIEAELQRLRPLMDESMVHADLFPHIVSKIHGQLADMKETNRVFREQGFDEARKIILSGRGKQAMDELRRDLDVMKREEDRIRESRIAEKDNVFRSALIGCIITSVLGLGLSYAVTWLLLRNDRVQRKLEWSQTGKIQLAADMAGEKTPELLAESVLTFLTRHIGAQVGVMYAVRKGHFERLALIGASGDETVPEKFDIGEGLLGRVVADREPLYVQDVPDSYLRIGSGLGEGRPRYLMVLPIVSDHIANAVIELGFMKPLDLHSQTFLNQSTENIGAAVKSSLYREYLQELLAETQQQSEELQVQGEELRVSNEELEEQARALKESQARLELQQTEMEQINTQLEEQTQILERQKSDILDSKTALEIQAQEVERASRYKSDFLANMSHELRTPLNSSLILAKLLSENRNGNLTSEQVKYARTIESAGNDLLILINDVLDLSKIEAGHMEISPAHVSVRETAKSMRDIFEPLTKEKGVSLVIEIEKNLPETIETDPQRLDQILKNLLSNAVKFTEKGEVGLRISKGTKNRISFMVSDTGIGIPAEKRRTIFEPFFQGDAGTSRKYGGTGLGLSISLNLARLLGGEVRVTSEVGKGSSFTLLIPETYTEGVKPDSFSLIDDSIVESGSDENREIIQHKEEDVTRLNIREGLVADDRSQLSGKGYVILVVEDDQAFAEILYELAHEMDFECIVATSAAEALLLAKRYSPSAIVLDVGLPDNSGLMVLEQLKADRDTRHIPVHVVSAGDYSRTALSLGAVGYMLKPVRRDQLVDAFRKLEAKIRQEVRRVLVVEDDQVQMEAMRDLLGSRDVEAICASTAAECLDYLRSSTFDCMVLDLSLPDSSGYALLEKLSKEQTYSFPPVIVYTGRVLGAEEEQRLRKYSRSIIIKGAKSPERLLDEVTLFLHQVVSELPAEKRKLIEKAINRDDSLEGRSILIAEDDVRNVFALTSLLEGRGVKLQIARNGREALEMLDASLKDRDKKIDLVLMDIMMPEMDGLTAMKEIRKRSEWKKLPIIALTAKAMRSDQEQCLAAGANDYLAKPLDVEKLLSLVRVWMPR